MNVPKVTLQNGVEMPQLGLGVWQVEEGDEIRAAVSKALEVGYRAIDTAAAYGNESGVGKAIADSGIAREEIFVTTKLWNDDQGYDATLRAFDASMDKLGLERLDLYLIHWALPQNGLFIETWKAFEKLYKDGRIRAIGVSNFKQHHLDELIEKTEIVPMVNQIELHPKLSQKPMREYAGKIGMLIESWSPLMQGSEALEDEVIRGIANSHNKTPAQAVLRWHIQSGLIVIPKSVTPERIEENFDIFDFELTDNEMAALDGLNRDEKIGPDLNES